MSDVTVFSHESFGQVRHVMIDGEPWFVLADVCRVLEIGNPGQAATYLDEDEKQQVNANIITNDVASGGRDPWLINESGLYSMILRSRKPHAKAFKKWVTSEVLPTIRKTGQYGNDFALPKTFAEALELAAAQQRALEAAEKEKQQLSAELSIASPKAEKWEAYMNSEGLIGMTELSKVLGMSVQSMTKMLVDKNVFYPLERPEGTRRVPYKKYTDNGMFNVKIEAHGGGSRVVVYALPSGADHVMDLSGNPLASLK